MSPDAENPDAENPDAEHPDAENPDAEAGAGESSGPADEPVGTLAEEAAKLFAALSGLAGTAREQGSDLGETVAGFAEGWGDRLADGAHDVDEHLATGAAECRYCPVCRGVDLLRRTDPEVVLHLGAAAQSLSRAVAAMLATANVEERRSRRPSGTVDVEHIDLDGDVDLIHLGDEPDPEQEEHR